MSDMYIRRFLDSVSSVNKQNKTISKEPQTSSGGIIQQTPSTDDGDGAQKETIPHYLPTQSRQQPIGQKRKIVVAKPRNKTTSSVFPQMHRNVTMSPPILSPQKVKMSVSPQKVKTSRFSKQTVQMVPSSSTSNVKMSRNPLQKVQMLPSSSTSKVAMSRKPLQTVKMSTKPSQTVAMSRKPLQTVTMSRQPLQTVPQTVAMSRKPLQTVQMLSPTHVSPSYSPPVNGSSSNYVSSPSASVNGSSDTSESEFTLAPQSEDITTIVTNNVEPPSKKRHSMSTLDKFNLNPQIVSNSYKTPSHVIRTEKRTPTLNPFRAEQSAWVTSNHFDGHDTSSTETSSPVNQNTSPSASHINSVVTQYVLDSTNTPIMNVAQRAVDDCKTSVIDKDIAYLIAATNTLYDLGIHAIKSRNEQDTKVVMNEAIIIVRRFTETILARYEQNINQNSNK